MSKISSNKILIGDVSNYVTEMFNKSLPSWAVYHNLSHTIETVQACEEIGNGSALSEDDMKTLYISAWFHDIGYIYQADGHEEISSKIASEYLNERNYKNEIVNKVVECIMVTKVSNDPKDLVESVICDADLISLSTTDYLVKNNLLKTELEQREKKKISDLVWLRRSLNFLTAHKYYTTYARKNYANQLKINIHKHGKMM